MRQFLGVVLVGLIATVVAVGQEGGGKVEVKGPHICCKQCVNVAVGILKKVDGVSDAEASSATKSVSFTAKDSKAAAAGVKALIDGGFFGSATVGGKEHKVDVAAAPKGEKAEKVVVKDVHVCCGQCVNAVNKVAKEVSAEAKVSYEGKGPQKTVIVEGSGLDRGQVLEALRKAGFNGVLQK